MRGKSPSKLSVRLTSCYCLGETPVLLHEAGVSAGTKADAGGFSVISIGAINYKNRLWGVCGNCAKSNGGCVSGQKSRGFMVPRCCILDEIVYCSSCESFGSTLSVPVLLFFLSPSFLSFLQA